MYIYTRVIIDTPPEEILETNRRKTGTKTWKTAGLRCLVDHQAHLRACSQWLSRWHWTSCPYWSLAVPWLWLGVVLFVAHHKHLQISNIFKYHISVAKILFVEIIFLFFVHDSSTLYVKACFAVHKPRVDVATRRSWNALVVGSVKILRSIEVAAWPVLMLGGWLGGLTGS